jgi:hypothetical protein
MYKRIKDLQTENRIKRTNEFCGQNGCDMDTDAP